MCTQCVALGASRARGYRADVGSRPAVEATAARILADCGRPIDVLISNAGVVIGNRLIDTTIDEIESYINSDFLSTLWLIKAFLPSMLARGSIGKVGGCCSIVQGTSLARRCIKQCRAGQHAAYRKCTLWVDLMNDYLLLSCTPC